MKNWFKDNKVKLLKISLSIFVLVCISAIFYILLHAFGLDNIEFIRGLVNKAGVLGWLMFVLLFVLVSVFTSFFPLNSALMVALGNVLFNDFTLLGMIKTSGICLFGVLLSSYILFLIGRLGGISIGYKLFGKEDIEKARELVDTKSKVYLPLMFAFPIFPDDALCFVVGMTKMKTWLFLTIATIFRGLGVITICFLGSNFLHYELFTLLDWFLFITCCVVWLIIIFYFARKLDKKISKK